jgi:hypothetical protein
MPQKLLSVNFGKLKADALGPLGVGYQLLDRDGNELAARTTTGVYQTAPGIYAVMVSLSNNFVGHILWDTGSYFTSVSYASEHYNEIESLGDLYNVVAEMDSRIQDIYHMQFGRWKIINKQMIFYKADNITEIARFDLFDDSGNPSAEAVFERVKV